MKVPKIINPEELKAFSVTIEPAGGKAQPTGPAYLKESLRGLTVLISKRLVRNHKRGPRPRAVEDLFYWFCLL